MAAGAVEVDQYFALPKGIEFIEKDGWYDPKLASGKTIFMFARLRHEDVGTGGVRDRVFTWKYDFGIHRFLKCGGNEHNYEA